MTGAATRPVIVHVIDSLTRGGAETLLVNLLPTLAEQYEIVLVTLKPDSDFDRSEIAVKDLYCLGYSGTRSLLGCAWKLRRIIRRHAPVLVRSQLFVASIVARIATPPSVPMVFSIHNPMSEDSYTRNRLALPLEKLTYRSRHAVISVSKSALEDFQRWVGIKGKSYVLYNFVGDRYFSAPRVRESGESPLRMVAVGMLKEQKNYFLLTEAFRQLRGAGISLDIYGDGPLRGALAAEIEAHDLPIRLMGKRPDIYAVLQDYDLYVMSSHYEGFGIAAAEAMATGLPMILSDLPVLREVTFGNALFFDPASATSFCSVVQKIQAGEVDLKALSLHGLELAAEHYRREAYVARLAAIYADVSPGCRPAATGGTAFR